MLGLQTHHTLTARRRARCVRLTLFTTHGTQRAIVHVCARFYCADKNFVLFLTCNHIHPYESATWNINNIIYLWYLFCNYNTCMWVLPYCITVIVWGGLYDVIVGLLWLKCFVKKFVLTVGIFLRYCDAWFSSLVQTLATPPAHRPARAFTTSKARKELCLSVQLTV